MENAFDVRKLTVEFKGNRVLDINELDFASEKIHALIGPSGAGKSTLLRVLNLLQKPSAGQVQYFGRPLSFTGPEKLVTQRSMAMVFQKPAMFSGSVYHNVSLGLKLRNKKTSDIKTVVQKVLETVGLADLANRSALTLSGGEAQRAALARALVVNPKMLLLDEPTANLDPANVSLIEDIIRKIHVETSITIIIVTHNLYQAKRISEHTVFLNKGKVVETGSTNELFNNPKIEETRLFISGDMIY